ncbi:toxin [Streptomyces cahuitamycinicus]|uniref:Toxin n=1 Tax=Streptomyces cahuitamycinicus TaxID=2070367 RepID=A0A2N8TKC8_9ACTN|nr:toxin [Streptomyces cahuitamycinicus]PNG19429.1 toxin [Streptomyces cahuitamycinicus]
MNDEELRRYCAGIVEELDIPEGADVNALCDHLEQRWGRPISLIEVPLPTGVGKPCGLWVATDDAYYICYQKYTVRAHQEHIVRHEIAHGLCGHAATEVMPDEMLRLLMPTLSPGLVRSVLGRTTYTVMEERAAELIASLLPLKAGTMRRASPHGPGMGNLVSHLGRSLERSGPA